MAADNLSQTTRERRGPTGSMSLTKRRARREASLAQREETPEDKEAKAIDNARKVAADVKQARKTDEMRKIADFSRLISDAVATGNTIRAAELRVQRAQRSLASADSPAVKANAQTTFDNAKEALTKVRREAEKNKKKAESKRGSSRSEAVKRVDAKRAAPAPEQEQFVDPH